MNSVMKCSFLGLFIRLVVVVYSEWHDKYFSVPYTDIDYKVFSDAARHVAEGNSPYKRHTYRYPPLVAWLLVPIVVFPCWGKVLFAVIDVFISTLYVKLAKFYKLSDLSSLRCAQVWLFNPLAIIISTRGNSDALISFTVLLSAYFILKEKPIMAGLFLAFAIHIRLYPIIFSLPMYLSLKPGANCDTFTKKVSMFFKKLYPCKNQIIFVLICIIFLFSLSFFCYYLYGYEFLEESILFHLTRKDTRHNFSVYFYLLYLEPEQPGVLMFLPQVILLLLLSITYNEKSNLLFCLFAQTFVVVSYNPVLTSQYFIWYLSLLIPSYHLFDLTFAEAGKLIATWLFSQLAWLVPAYLLEFRGRNTFLYIWLQGIGFFCANLAVLVKLIKSYKGFQKKRE